MDYLDEYMGLSWIKLIQARWLFTTPLNEVIIHERKQQTS